MSDLVKKFTAEPKPMTTQEKEALLKEGNSHFKHVKITRDPHKDSDNYWFEEKRTAAIKEVLGSTGKDGKPIPHNYHIQMFSTEHQFDHLAKFAKKAHDATAGVIPTDDPNTRLVVKTAQAVKQDSNLTDEQKEKILGLMASLPAAEGSGSHDVVMNEAKRAVLVYKTDGNGGAVLQRAFGANLQGDFTPYQQSNAYHTHKISALNLEVKNYYNAGTGITGDIFKKSYEKATLPLKVDTTDPYSYPADTKDAWAPTPEAAGQFLQQMRDQKLTLSSPEKPAGIPADLLAAAAKSTITLNTPAVSITSSPEGSNNVLRIGNKENVRA